MQHLKFALKSYSNSKKRDSLTVLVNKKISNIYYISE